MESSRTLHMTQPLKRPGLPMSIGSLRIPHADNKFPGRLDCHSPAFAAVLCGK